MGRRGCGVPHERLRGLREDGVRDRGGAGFPISDGGLNVTVEGFYGQNNHKDAPDGNTTTPYGIMGGFECDLDTPGESSVTPYVSAQAGILWQKYESDTFGDATDSTFGYGGDAGVSFPIGGVDGWVEGRLTNGSIDDGGTSYNTMFGRILAGIGINLGS